MESSLFAQITHGLTLTGIVALLALALDKHAIYLRIKERLDTLWRDRCIEKDEEFVPLDGRERR